MWIIRHMWVVSICFMLSMTGAVLWTLRQVPFYRAVADVELSGPQKDESAHAFRIRMQNRISDLRSDRMVHRLYERSGRTEEDIAAKLVRLAAESVRGTSTVRLVADARDPMFAADMANAWATSVREEESTSNATVKILSMARPPRAPSNLRRLKTLWLAAVGGVALGVALAGLRAYVDVRRNG